MHSCKKLNKQYNPGFTMMIPYYFRNSMDVVYDILRLLALNWDFECDIFNQILPPLILLKPKSITGLYLQLLNKAPTWTGKQPTLLLYKNGHFLFLLLENILSY